MHRTSEPTAGTPRSLRVRWRRCGKVWSALLPLLAAASSCGTVYTRGQVDVVGCYPLQAVVHDVRGIVQVFDPPPASRSRSADSGFVGAQALVSLPFDLVLDIVLAPVDLGAWIFGYSKAA